MDSFQHLVVGWSLLHSPHFGFASSSFAEIGDGYFQVVDGCAVILSMSVLVSVWALI